ncbi:hypothetical protein pb186bvf_012916 [Paramecium bursaria]
MDLPYHSKRIPSSQGCKTVNTNLQNESDYVYKTTEMKSSLNRMRPKQRLFNFEQTTISNDSTLVEKLKQETKQLRCDLLKVLKESDQMKKDIRYSRFQELSIELEHYQQECKRLKLNNQTLQEMIQLNQGSELQDQYIIKEQTIKKLYQENHEIILKISQLMQENQYLKQKIDRLETQLNQSERDIKMIKKQQNQDTIQSPLMSRQQIYKESVETARQFHNLQIELEKQKKLYSKDISHYQQLLDGLNKVIQQQEQTIKEYESMSIKVQPNRIETEQQILLDSKIEEQKSQLIQEIQQEEQLNQLQLFKQQSTISYKIQMPQLMKKQSMFYEQIGLSKQQSVMQNDSPNQSSFFVFDERSISKANSRKKMIRVNQYEVQEIAKRLKFEFQIKHLAISQVEQSYDDYAEETLCIQDLLIIFQTEPFKISNEKERLLLARYLVEDNAEEQVWYDSRLTQNVEMVKTIFRILIGQYDLFEEWEIQRMKDKFKNFFTKNNIQFIDSIHVILSKKKDLKFGCCDIQDFVQAVRNCDLNVTNREQEYLTMLSFEQNRDLKCFEYMIIKDIFQK